MKRFKTLGYVSGLIAAALVGGTLISVVSAAPSTPGTPSTAVNTADKGKYCDTWRQNFADALGVSVDKLNTAGKAATDKTIDAAVAAGDLTAAQGTAWKARVDAFTGDLCNFIHPLKPGLGPVVRFGVHLVDSAASALGMSDGDLLKALRGGKSLKDVATDQGKNYADVTKAIHDAAKADLDKAVTAGMDQARADKLLADIDAALANGKLAGGGMHRGFGFRFGPRTDAPVTTPAS
ncbi:MAG: hypothetical protein ACXWWU_05095 [Candidatus Limnocylindria bacterium]